jgi:phosphonate transport system ATP-binding protein
MKTVIEIEGVHVVYGSTLAVDIERLAIGAAERVFVLGASGSGKTTLARLVKGRVRPTTGTVRVLGENPAASGAAGRAIQRRVAMIDQEFFLVPRSSVVSTALHGALGRTSPWRSLLGWFPPQEWEKAEAILREVGLEGLGGRRVESLSGGQRQRAAIARALMQEAEIIVADEPVSNLDPELAEDALELLVACVARRGETLVVNIHQPELARRFATRIVGLAAGRVVYDGAPESFTAEKAALLYRRDEPGREEKPATGKVVAIK